MFAHGKCDMGYKQSWRGRRPVFQGSRRAPFARRPDWDRTDEMTPDAYGLLMANWSIVHGFAHLALGGEFDRPASRRGGKERNLEIVPAADAEIPAR